MKPSPPHIPQSPVLAQYHLPPFTFKEGHVEEDDDEDEELDEPSLESDVSLVVPEETDEAEETAAADCLD